MTFEAPLRGEAASAVETLELAEEVAVLGHWQYVFETGAITWSDQVYRIYGVTRDTFAPTLMGVLESYHPDDRGILAARITQAKQSGEGYDQKLRIRRVSDHAERVVIARGVVRRNSAGEPVALFGVTQDVTDDEALLRRATESETRLRLLAETAPDIIATYRSDLSFLYLSAAVQAVTGFAPEELIGRSFLDMIHPEDRAQVAVSLSSYARQGCAVSPIRIEYRAIHKNGCIIWLEAHPRAIFDDAGYVVEFYDVIRNITERKSLELKTLAARADADAARDKAANSEAMYRLLADQSVDIIVTMTLDGEISYCSPACRHYGYEPDTLTGSQMGRLVHPEDLPSIVADLQALYQPANAGAFLTRELRVLTRSGQYVWAEGKSTVVRDEDGAPLSTITVLRDVTRRKALEDDLLRAKRGAEAASQAKSEFLANMSHELRTPLTAVIGFSGLLRDLPNLPEAAHRYIQRIATASTSLLAIINDVLDFSKLEANLVLLDPRPTNLRKLTSEVCAALQDQAASKTLKLVQSYSGDLPERVDVDDGRLRQILVNLIGNAIKFTDQGEVEAALSLTPFGLERRLRVEVRDTGPGLSPENKGVLFERFTQGDSSITRAHGGSGLGLSICRRLVEQMGGAIGVESELGAGSCFWFEIPAPISLQPLPAPSSFAPFVFQTPRRALVVANHWADRELLTTILTEWSVEVQSVALGEDALSACCQTPFDIILLDTGLTDMDAMEATRAIRSRCGLNGGAAIIALGGKSDDQTAELRLSGVDDGIDTPIDLERLHSKIASWLDAPVDEASLVM